MASRVLLVKNRNNYRYKIAALDRLISEIEMSGMASGSISAGGGSQSYTYADLDKLEKRRSVYAARLEAINMALAAYPNATGIRHVQTIRSGVW